MRMILLLGLLGFTVASSLTLAESTPTTTSQAKGITSATTNALSSASDTKQIENTVHQYLLKKPEVVVEALQVYQQKQTESMQQLFKETQKLAPQYADKLFHQAGDPVVGNPNGKVTLVEFFDYRCPHCVDMNPIVDNIVKANPDLKVVFKEFPIRSGLSVQAAYAGLAANKQPGKYFAFREALFKVSADLTEGKILEAAKSAGLNMSQFEKDMKSTVIHDEVKADQQLAVNLKLIGTPAFFVAKSDIKNGAPVDAVTYIPGVASQAQLQLIIDKTAGK